MTNENTTADVRISNWTLATGTKPGMRHVYSPTRDAAQQAAPALQQVMDGGGDDSTQVLERAA